MSCKTIFHKKSLDKCLVGQYYLSQRTVSSVRQANEEVKKVSDRERGEIMDALKDLPEADKQFMLGYAAGRSASVEEPAAEAESDQKEKTD